MSYESVAVKTFFHPDYWAEIPEGEFIAGISDEQRENLIQESLRRLGYWKLDPSARRQLEPLIEKSRAGEELDADERSVWDQLHKRLIDLQIRLLMTLPPRRVIWLKRFYLSRFPLTWKQERLGFKLLKGEIQIDEFPGALEPPFLEADREAAHVYVEQSLHLCERLGVRIPTADEWEKAARGTDGRLYPWGNEWNPDAGLFYPNQAYSSSEVARRAPSEVDAFPEGQSPYGVWGMIGGDKELAEIPPPKPRTFQGKEITPLSYRLDKRQIYLGLRGGRLRYKERSADLAFSDCLPMWDGGNDFVNLRPAADELPPKKWAGVPIEIDPGAEV